MAVILAITSMVVELPGMSVNYHLEESIQMSPAWELDPLKNPSEKNQERSKIIAQDFIPIVIIADAPVPSGNFIHYLPLFTQTRINQYFLLI